MLERRVWYVLRIGLPYILVLALLSAVAPQVFNATRTARAQLALVGPKAYYLALGDSLAFGYQPNLDWAAGYSTLFYNDLVKHGVQHYDNLACPGESSVSMIKGGCAYALLRKYIYVGAQLQAAVKYLHDHAGQVSPVTLDIGGNDLIPDLNTARCTINSQWQSDLAVVDNNLKNVILPQLIAAMTVNGQMTGDLILLNYYDPYQDACPNTLSDIQTFNQNLAADVSGRATLIDVFGAFADPIAGDTATTPDHTASATATTPDHTASATDHIRSSASNLCVYTWMCSNAKNIHPTRAGYSLIASTIEHTVNY